MEICPEMKEEKEIMSQVVMIMRESVILCNCVGVD